MIIAVSRILVWCFLLLVLIVSIPMTSAQDPTPTPSFSPTMTSAVSETPLPTSEHSQTPLPTATLELPSLSPTDSPTIPVNVSPTQPIVPTHTDTPILSTDTPVAEVTDDPAISDTPTQTASFAPSPTMNAISGTTATLMPTDTSTMPQPEWSLLFADNFDSGDTSAWQYGSGWGFLPEATGQALRVYNSAEPVTFTGGNFSDVRVDAEFIVDHGTAQMHVRQSAAGRYTATLDNLGNAAVYRNEVLVQSTSITLGLPEQGHQLRLIVLGDTLRVTVDDIEVMVFVDPTPLPAGEIAISASFDPLANNSTPIPPVNTVVVDDVAIWLPLVSASTPSPTAMETVGPTDTMLLTDTASPTQAEPVAAVAAVQLFITDDISITDPTAQPFLEAATTHIAMVGFFDEINKPNQTDILIFNPDETTPGAGENSIDPQLINVTNTINENEIHPTISPDGQWLAYTLLGSPNQIVVISANDPTQRYILGEGQLPSWSPDGSQLAFVIADGDADVFVADFISFPSPSLGTPIQVTSSPITVLIERPSWSPDGTQLVIHDRHLGNLNLIDVTSPPYTPTLLIELIYGYQNRSVEWSKSSAINQIAFYTSLSQFPYDIYTIVPNPANPSPTLLQTTDPQSEVRLDWAPPLAETANGAQLIYAAVGSSSIRRIDVPNNSPETVYEVSGKAVGSIISWSRAFKPLETCPVAISSSSAVNGNGCPTETPTPTNTPIGSICLATISTSSSINLRSGPSVQNQIIVTLTNGQSVNILGQFGNWFYVELENMEVGWIGLPQVLVISEDCVTIPSVDENGNPIMAIYDFELQAPPVAWRQPPPGYCTGDSDIENFTNCARVVYYWYYFGFIEAIGRPPNVSDMLGAIYRTELGTVTLLSNGYNNFASSSSSSIAQEAHRNNFWSVVYTQIPSCADVNQACDPFLTAEEITEHYLVQVQSWYQLALFGSPNISKLNEDLIELGRAFTSVGLNAVSQRWLITDRPRQWGNYGYSLPGYDAIVSDPSKANLVAYCQTIHMFIDGDGDPNNQLDPNVDFWSDYRFVIITATSLGFNTSTYNHKVHPRPPWLDQQIQVEGEQVYYRNTILRRVALQCT